MPSIVHAYPYRADLPYLIFLVWEPKAFFRNMMLTSGISNLGILGQADATQEEVEAEENVQILAQLAEIKKQAENVKANTYHEDMDLILGVHEKEIIPSKMKEYIGLIEDYYILKFGLQKSEDKTKNWASIGLRLALAEMTGKKRRGRQKKPFKTANNQARASYVDDVQSAILSARYGVEDALEEDSFPYETEFFAYNVRCENRSEAEYFLNNVQEPKDEEILHCIYEIMNTPSSEFYEVFKNIDGIAHFSSIPSVDTALQYISNGRRELRAKEQYGP